LQVGESVFISGQIGLIPSQLTMPFTSLAKEVALSSQHVARIAAALRDNAGGGWEGHTTLNLYWFTSLCSLSHLKKGHLVLKVLFTSVVCHRATGYVFIGTSISDCLPAN
jgi:diphthine-ammonia ligase